VRDAARSREHLLAAALDEFAKRGFAGARVEAIAARAGVNKQLISYYFGGKKGLYDALRQAWLAKEAAFVPRGGPLEELVLAYLKANLEDPRMTRLLLWEGLAEGAGPKPPAAAGSREDLSDLERRKAEGQLASDIDPGLLQLALMGAVSAPVAMPHIVRRLTGMDPTTPEFEPAYGDQLRRIIRRLARK
jgi:AcrR family transcriptional regulator